MLMFSKLYHLFQPANIAVDLGTANTRIFAPNLGEIVEKPSIVSLVNQKKSMISDNYFQYINAKLAITPLKGGVIVDLEKTIALLRPLIQKSKGAVVHPISLACAPTDTSEKERNLLSRALTNAGSSRVSIIPEVWAAAIGAGLDLSQSKAQLLIDIGDGVTDMAVFRDGRIVFASAVRIACSDLQKAVRSAIIMKHKIQIPILEAERLTNEMASYFDLEKASEKTVHTSGIDLVKRKEVHLEIKSCEIIDAITPVISKIIRMIENALRKLPEKLYCEIIESGIWLTGGGACIDGIDKIISLKTLLNVRVSDDPIHAVINGSIQTLNYWCGEKCWWENLRWPKIPLSVLPR